MMFTRDNVTNVGAYLWARIIKRSYPDIVLFLTDETSDKSCTPPLECRPLYTRDFSTDYVDLCGEPEFMQRTLLKFHEAAQAKGVIVMHACAFGELSVLLFSYPGPDLLVSDPRMTCRTPHPASACTVPLKSSSPQSFEWSPVIGLQFERSR